MPRDGLVGLFAVGFLFFSGAVGVTAVDAGQASIDATAPNCSTVTYEGTGTEQTPYEVGTVDQLQCMSEDLDARYEQTTDINAAETAAWAGGSGFEPVGTQSFGSRFTGTLDGNGYSITGLVIDRPAADTTGLVGYAGNDANITGVRLANASVTGADSVGGLVGTNGFGATVRASSVTGRIEGTDDVGGLVGTNGGAVGGSDTGGRVEGRSFVGGLVGANNRDGAVRGSNTTARVDGGSFVGGLVGDNPGGVRESYATGRVTGGSTVAGLVGENGGSVRRSYATGRVNGSSFSVGGLVAINDADAVVSESYATGRVVSRFGDAAGLVSLNNGLIRDSYAVGRVTGGGSTGGLVGTSDGGEVRGSYWDRQTTEQNESAGGVGRSTDQMTGAAARQGLSAFDFGSTWVVTRPDAYPTLSALRDELPTEFFVTPDAGFATTPTRPTAGTTTTFRTGTVRADRIVSVRWAFGDGTTATGPQVSHTYATPGTYRVTQTLVTTEGSEFARSHNLTVEAADEFGISAVTPHIDGVPQEDVAVLESVAFNLSYHVNVVGPGTLKNVTFQIDGRSYNGARTNNTWVFEVAPDSLDPGAQFTATATNGTGTTDTVARPIEVVDVPDWLEGFTGTVLADQSTVEFSATLGVPPSSLDLSLTIPDRFDFPISVPLANQSQDPSASATLTVTVDLATLSTAVTVTGSTEYNLTSRLTVRGSLTGSGYFDLQTGTLTRATAGGTVGATIEYPPPPIGIPSPPVGPVPPGAVRLFPIFDIQLGANANFTAGDGSVPLQFQNGSLEPRLTARQELGQKYEAFEVVFGLEERLAASVPVPGITPVNGSIGAQAYVRASALGFQQRLAFPPGGDRLTYPFSVGTDSGAAGSRATGWVDTDGAEWTLRESAGETPPKPAARASDGTLSTADVTGSGFITNDSVDDTDPSLTRLEDGHLAVWSRQDGTATLNGRDIYLSRRTDESFGSPEPVTDDDTREFDPAVAGPTRDEQVVVFATLNRTVDPDTVAGPTELFPNTEIGLTTATGDGNWTEPQLLTDETTDDRQTAPTVGYSNGTWLIAWQETPPNPSGPADRQVTYLWYNGTASETTTVSGARDPVVAPTGDGSLQLTYLDMDGNRTSGEVTLRTFDPATRTRQATARYAVTQFGALALAGGTLAWTDEASATAVEFVAGGGDSPTAVPLGLSGTPQSISLTTSNGTTLLNARAFAPNRSVTQVSYAPRVDGEWLPAETYADGSAQNLTYWQGTSAPASDGFVSVFAGKDLDTDQRYDLYTFDQTFRPDLGVTATTTSDPGNTTAGDTVTLDYTVRNTGVEATTATPIGLRTNETVTVVETRSGLAPGATLTGHIETTVDETGTVAVVADPQETTGDRDRQNNSATVRLVDPTLTVRDVALSRANGTQTVSLAVENPLDVRVPRFAYTVEAGPAIERAGTISPLAPGEQTTLSVTAPVGDVDPQAALRLQARPAGADAGTPTVRFSTPLRPQLSLAPGQIGYVRNETTTAVVTVGNAGLTGTGAVLNVTNQTTGRLVATERLRVNASSGLTDTAFARAVVPLGNVPAGQPLRIEVSRTARPERVAAVAVDTVEPGTALLPPDAEIRLNRTTAAVDWPVAASAANASSPVGEVAGFQWAATGAQSPTDGPTLVFTPAETGTETVSLVVVNDRGLPRLVERTVEVVGLPGEKPPRDIDGDGTYEDVSGVRGFNVLDVQVLFNTLNTAVIQDNRDAFKFADVGDEVSVLDVQALFNEL
jgi:hypothetical protein